MPFKHTAPTLVLFGMLAFAMQTSVGFSAISTRKRPVQRTIHRESSSDDLATEDQLVPVTPCTRICRYNSNVFDGKVCIGCFRETFEIGNWQSLAPIEKYYALLDAADRLEAIIGSNTIEESDTGISRQDLLLQADYWKSLSD